MNDKIKIYLPTTTELAHILHLLYKVTDVIYWKESNNYLRINENIPCSKNNPWEIVFGHRPGYNITGFGKEQTIHFADQVNNKYTIDYCLDNKNDLSKGVSLIMDINATLVCIAEKIVDLFSGEIYLAKRKGMDFEDIEEIYSSSIPSFEQVENFSHNYFYQNALEAIKPLVAKNLLDKREQGFWSDSDYNLIYALDPKYHKSYFDMQELNNDLDNKNNKNNNKKVKV